MTALRTCSASRPRPAARRARAARGLAAGADRRPGRRATTRPRSLAWAVLAEAALADGRTVEGYAYARTGYHRGLDALRRNGWKGHGPVPVGARAEPRVPAGAARARPAAAAIGEDDEAARCAQFLADSSPHGRPRAVRRPTPT